MPSPARDRCGIPCVIVGLLKGFHTRNVAKVAAEAGADARTDSESESEAASVWRSLDTHKAWLAELPVGQLIT